MNTPELNLNDPLTVEKLKNYDVLSPAAIASQPGQEVKEVEQKIKGLRNASTFKLKLTAAQLTKLERDSVSAGHSSWQSYLQFLIDTKIFNGAIGAPLIAKPSFAKQSITGPSIQRG